MKKLFFSLLAMFVIFSTAKAVDLEYPSLIDGGEINTRYHIDLVGKTNNYKTIYISIKNISNELIYFYDTKKIISYDSAIYANGNQIFFLPLSNSTNIFPGDSTLGCFQFFTTYLDSVSISGGKLKSVWRIYYRKESSIKLDSIDITAQFRAIQKDEVIFDSYFNHSDNTIDNYGVDSDTSYNSGFLYNLTGRLMIVDSIKYNLIGKNIKSLDLLNQDTLIKLPYNINLNKALTFSVKYIPLQPEESLCPIDIFYHFKDSTGSYLIQDTIVYKWELLNHLILRSPMQNSTNIKLGDTFGLSNFYRVFVLNADDRLWKLVKLTKTSISSNDSQILLYDSIPIKIVKNQGKNLFKLLYYAKQSGFDTVKVDLELEDTLSNIIHRSLVYYFNVQIKTDIIENKIYDYENITIYPNPASDFIEFSLPIGARRALPLTLEIYDILGLRQSPPNPLLIKSEQLRLDVSSLVPGVYFVKIGNRVQKFVKI